MRLKKLIKRISFVFFFFLISLFIFHIYADRIIAEIITDKELHTALHANITILFLILFATGFFLTLFNMVRDYKGRGNFLREIKTFSDMVRQGEVKGRVFFEEYPDLADVYNYLNQVAGDLKKKFENAATESIHLKAVMNSLPDSLIIIDNRDIVVFSNDKTSEFINRESIVDRPVIEVLRSPDIIDAIQKVKTADLYESIEIEFDYPDERYIQVLLSPFYQKNNLCGIIILLHDITRLKKLEVVRRDFVANVSHEIKTPVTAIKGFSETLIDGAIDDKGYALRFLHNIYNQSERLNRLVDDLLTLSKIELGYIKPTKREVVISNVLDEVKDTLIVKATEKGLDLREELHKNFSVNADRDKLIQILLNLLDNAIKFTDSGEITIGSSMEGERNYLFVHDTGIGVPAKSIERLGERFFRVDTSRSRELGGTGLGLAIVKHLVRSHGWEMEILSEKDIGTEVRIFVV